jgi:hypothetical protein
MVKRMATVKQIVLICDFCEKDGAETHTIAADGKTVELEACSGCWSKAMKPFEAALEVGRRKRRSKVA